MTGPFFKVVFEGRLVAGAEPPQVKAALGRLFKAEPARIEAMFTGASVVVRRQLDAATARQYVDALERAGALARIEGMEETEPAAVGVAVASVAPPGNAAPLPAALATPAPAVLRAMQGAPVAPTLDVAAVGSLLVDPAEVPAANIATDHLSLAAVGSLLVEPVDVPEPAFDLSGLSLAPVGVDITEPMDTPPAQFDLSGLSLAPQPASTADNGRKE